MKNKKPTETKLNQTMTNKKKAEMPFAAEKYEKDFKFINKKKKNKLVNGLGSTKRLK